VRSCQQFDAGLEVGLLVLDQDGQPEDLSDVASAVVLLESPTGRRKQRDAIVDVPGSRVLYRSQALDLDEWGEWRLQARLLGPDYDVRTRVQLLLVHPNADAPELVVRPDAVVSEGLVAAALLGGGGSSLEQVQAGEEPGDVSQDYEVVVNLGISTPNQWLKPEHDVTWVEDGPPFGAPWPRFEDSALSEWSIQGRFAHVAGAQSLEAELVVDDVPTGMTFAFANSTAAAAGWWRFVPRLQTDSELAGGNRLRCSVEFERYGNSDALLDQQTVGGSVSFDPSVSHVLRWRFRHAVDLAGSTLQPRNWVGVWAARRTGS